MFIFFRTTFFVCSYFRMFIFYTFSLDTLEGYDNYNFIFYFSASSARTSQDKKEPSSPRIQITYKKVVVVVDRKRQKAG